MNFAMSQCGLVAKILYYLYFGATEWHKPLHTFRLRNDVFFMMAPKLLKYVSERCRTHVARVVSS